MLRTTSVYMLADATTPAGPVGAFVASSPRTAACSEFRTDRLPHLQHFEACSAFTHVSARMLAGSPKAIRCIRGSGEFVTSFVSPIATGWSDPSPGGTFTHWKLPPCHGAPELSLYGFEG